MSLLSQLKRILTTQDHVVPWILLLLIVELVLNVVIVWKVPYTEIDWKAYMQQIEMVNQGNLNYTLIRGDTGPLVYPGGHVAFFFFLYHLTNQGTNILLAQWIFVGFYMVTAVLVFLIYKETKAIPPYVFVLLCLSKRLHSIFALRLFNDTVAMTLLYLAVFYAIKNHWTLGSLFISMAVSIKMNVLLFMPAFGILLVKRFGLIWALPKLALMGLVQVVVALPFLAIDPWAYLGRAFEFSREFFYKWTVNLKMLPEEVFLSKTLALSLLAAHLSVLLFFIFFRWTRPEGGPFRLLLRDVARDPIPLTARHICLLMFSSNFVGMVFARSLHYQFYSWYFHSLPFLLWHSTVPLGLRFVIFGLIEVCWNVYPATWQSSSVLALCHLVLLLGLMTYDPREALGPASRPQGPGKKNK